MGLHVKTKIELFKLPNFGGLPNVFFADMLGTSPDSTTSPIVGSWFRMGSGPEATPPKYEYDEVGVMIEGEMNFRDEDGQTATVKQGDVFFFPRGSTMAFSSDSYGIAWKCGTRPMTKL